MQVPPQDRPRPLKSSILSGSGGFAGMFATPKEAPRKTQENAK